MSDERTLISRKRPSIGRSVLRTQGERSLAIAPEAGNERLRRLLNKKVSDATVREKVRLIASDVEMLRLHYAYTLRHWLDRAEKAKAEIVAMYDERFYRMWEFYLAGCEVSFRYMNQMVAQIQIAKRQDAVPMTRDYMAEAERREGVAPSIAAE